MRVPDRTVGTRGRIPLRALFATVLLVGPALVWLGPCGWLRREPLPVLASRAMPVPAQVRILQARDEPRGIGIVLRPYAREPERLALARQMAREFLGEAAATCLPRWLDVLNLGSRPVEIPKDGPLVWVVTPSGELPELDTLASVRSGEERPGPGNALWALFQTSRRGSVGAGHTRSVLVFLPAEAALAGARVVIGGRSIPLHPREVESAGLDSYVSRPGLESFQALARGEVAAGSS